MSAARNILTLALLLAAVASAPGGEGGADKAGWPMFRGPRGDGVTAEADWTHAWPDGGPKIVWKARVGNGYASMAVVGGRLYTMGNRDKQDTAWCLDALTGAEVWRFSYPSTPDGYPGPRATPTVDGGRVYIVSRHALMHCLDAATGKVIWRQDLTKTIGARFQMHGYSSSPVVFGDLLIVEAGAKDGAVAALDKATGALVWKSGEGEPGYSTPVLYEKAGETACRIAVFMADGLIGLDAKSGRQLYRFPFPVKFNHAIASPIVAADRVFISAGYGAGAALVDISAEPPRAVWKSIEFSNQFASSVLYKGYLYGFDGDNERQPFLKCVELATGKVMWSKDGFLRGSVLLAGERLIVLCGAGDLAVVEASPEGCKELARSKVLTGVCWTPPVLMNGLIYCRTQDGVLVCVDARGAAR